MRTHCSYSETLINGSFVAKERSRLRCSTCAVVTSVFGPGFFCHFAHVAFSDGKVAFVGSGDGRTSGRHGVGSMIRDRYRHRRTGGAHGLVAKVDGRGRESDFFALSGHGKSCGGWSSRCPIPQNEALRSPSAEGLKLTVIVNFCPARRVEPHRRAKKQYPLMFAARLSALQLWSAATRLPQELQLAVLRNSILQPNTTLA